MCTRILSNTSGTAVIVGRTMDWPDSTMPVITAFPRGMVRRGGHIGDVEAFPDDALQWTSRHGSLVTTVYGVGTADGVNERGLAVHLLYLEGTDFGDPVPGVASVHAGLWPQYLLDVAADVPEALEALEQVQVLMMESHGHRATVHMAIEDASGDSAVIEYLDGERVVHHGRDHTILTNEPPYPEQIRMLRDRDFSRPSDTTSLGGNVNPVDRFQRAAYFLSLLPEPANIRQAVAGVLAIARNVSIPFGAPYEGFGLYNTEYRTVVDLTNLRYFFELSTSPNVIWVDLASVDLAEGAPVRTMDPDDIALSGECSARMSPAAAPF